MKAKSILGKAKPIGLYALFTGPAVILFLTFILCPLVLAFRYSFFDWNGISESYHFIGWENYINIFKEAAFIHSFKFSISYTLIITFCLNLFGLLVAVALNAKLRLRTALRGAFFMPLVISPVAVGYLWNVIVVRLFPFIGELTGIEILTRTWFAYQGTAFASLVIATIWQNFGFYMMIYLTGLQGVPKELLEAADIDGASSIKKFFKITLPMIWPSITICIFLGLIMGLKSFDLIYSLTNGGPYGGTTSIAFQIYLDAFKRDMMSYASAKAVIFCILFAAISFIQVAVMKRREVEA